MREYVGISFCISGSFSVSPAELYKALKVISKLKCIFMIVGTPLVPRHTSDDTDLVPRNVPAAAPNRYPYFVVPGLPRLGFYWKPVGGNYS